MVFISVVPYISRMIELWRCEWTFGDLLWCSTKRRAILKINQVAQCHVQAHFEHPQGQRCYNMPVHQSTTLPPTEWRKNFFLWSNWNFHSVSWLHRLNNHSLDDGGQQLDFPLFLWPSLPSWASSQPLLMHCVPHPWDCGSVRVLLHWLASIVILFWNIVPEASIWEA